MEDLTKINFIKVIDKEKWLKDREDFRKNKIINDDISFIEKHYKQISYQTNRWELSSHLYNNYYLNLYYEVLHLQHIKW